MNNVQYQIELDRAAHQYFGDLTVERYIATTQVLKSIITVAFMEGADWRDKRPDPQKEEMIKVLEYLDAGYALDAMTLFTIRKILQQFKNEQP